VRLSISGRAEVMRGIHIGAPQFGQVGRSIVSQSGGVVWYSVIARFPSCNRREPGSVSQSPTPTDSVLAGDGQYSASIPLEGLVKMDHIQKEPPLNLKGTPGHQRGRNVRFVLIADIDSARNPGQTRASKNAEVWRAQVGWPNALVTPVLRGSTVANVTF
jgi:hypothetical protein